MVVYQSVSSVASAVYTCFWRLLQFIAFGLLWLNSLFFSFSFAVNLGYSAIFIAFIFFIFVHDFRFIYM